MKFVLTTFITEDLIDAHTVMCLCTISRECVFLEHQFSELVAFADYVLPEAVECAKYSFIIDESAPFLEEWKIPENAALYPLHISLLAMKLMLQDEISWTCN